MQTHELLRRLHDKATRNISVSAEEQALLNASYAEQDNEEAALLAGKPSLEPLTALRSQITATSSRLLAVAEQIQRLANENESLRQEITILQGQVTRSSTAQPA
jgi:hypothetical protein